MISCIILSLKISAYKYSDENSGDNESMQVTKSDIEQPIILNFYGKSNDIENAIRKIDELCESAMKPQTIYDTFIKNMDFETVSCYNLQTKQILKFFLLII